ncbi:YfgM family protein [Allopusillimonas ginsengisoli]|uniref:YfgM family protein n=1 Tax=Allopusillimonas ginsengisoli TaxID=453575 RepID=UPI0010C1E2EF|nr:tetratricopeptide repeat protein [Allopusillimonas ginsengisoli]
MAYDLEEQEKLDAMRAWWERYGTMCVVIAFVVAASVAGWRGWQWYQGHQASQAMGYYEALENAAAQDGDDAIVRIQAASQTLRDDFAKSGYTVRGALVAAEALRRHGELDAARAQLEWVIAKSGDAALIPLAHLRLAGIMLDQKQYDEALSQLENAPSSFAGLYADRRGDILFAQGKKEEARAAWNSALKSLGADPLAQIVQLKIDALGEA